MRNVFFLILLFSGMLFAENEKLVTLIVYEKSIQNDPVEQKGVIMKFDETKLATILKPFINQPVNEKLLKDTIIAFYQNRGEKLVAVNVQNDSKGILRVAIVRGTLGKIEVEGGKSKEKIVKKIKLKKGDNIDTCKLEDTIAWLNRDPFRTIDLIYKKGENLGETDLCLKVNEKFPFKGYVGWDNNHYPIAGQNRWTGGFQAGHLFGLDHQLNAEAIIANDPHHFWLFSGSYTISFDWRSMLKFFGNYANARPNPKDSGYILEGYDLVGRSWQFGARYHQLIRSYKKWCHEIIAGYDFRRTNNFLNFGVTPVYSHYIDISQFLLRYEGNYCTPRVKAYIGLSIIGSPGRMTAFNRDKNFDQERSGAKCLYSYQIFNCDLIIDIFQKWSYQLSSIIQCSTTKLMPTEEMTLGGHLSVRGFSENQVIGDRGILLKQELHTPQISLFSKKTSELIFLGFVDFGCVSEADKNLISKDTALLLSAGPGVRYSIKNHFSFRFDYGFQLKTPDGLLFGSKRDSLAHIGIYAGF